MGQYATREFVANIEMNILNVHTSPDIEYVSCLYSTLSPVYRK